MIAEHILIVTEQTDYSASLVMQWLLYFNTKVSRINSEDENLKISHFCMSSDDSKTSLKLGESLIFNSKKKQTVWFRRGYINFLSGKINIDSVLGKSLLDIGNNRKETIQHLNDEYSNLKISVYDYIYKNNNVINTPLQYQSNKLISLDCAKKSNLLIPETLITTNKEDLLSFYNLHKKLITKGIQEAHTIRTYNSYTATYTKSVTLDFINALPDHFIPSLFQNQINKFIELRVFIFDTLLFSMAIFSQNDKQTEVDFRVYNQEKPNRYVPFTIPKSLSKNLFTFMKKMNLKSGSIDLVLTPDNKYYFLEVNPVGQFSFVSQECNFNIEKEIANYLIKSNES